jgi:hypothetical protein
VIPPQLTLDGREVDRPVLPRPLTDRQREIMRFARSREFVRPIEVGRIMHMARDGAPKPAYFASDGSDALRRLARRGLVERVRRGRWVATTSDEGWRQ